MDESTRRWLTRYCNGCYKVIDNYKDAILVDGIGCFHKWVDEEDSSVHLDPFCGLAYSMEDFHNPLEGNPKLIDLEQLVGDQEFLENFFCKNINKDGIG